MEIAGKVSAGAVLQRSLSLQRAVNIIRPSSFTYHNRSSGDEKLLYDSQVLLVERLLETKEQGLVHFCGRQRLPPSAWRAHARS